MVKATELKSQNISEYIIHMYKSEDLVRTFEFDLNKITDYLIVNIPVSVSDKKEQILWYAALIEQMRADNIETKDHLNELKDLVNQLSNLHTKLIKQDKDYQKINSKANPFIQNQIKMSKNTVIDPVQICINSVYGFLLLKINNKAVTDKQQEMLNTFGDLLSYLSFTYKPELRL